MWLAVTSGILLGLSCGLSPGPLLTLVLSQSLRHGTREGCKVALAPLLTDLPIVLGALAVAAQVERWHKAMGFLSVVGGLFVLYLALDTMRPVSLQAGETQVQAKSLLKGVLTNLLNPQPWLFWMTVGAATVAQDKAAAGWAAVIGFLAMFYLFLVGSKGALAVISGRFRQFLSSRAYRLILVLFGLLLLGFAVLLFRAGLRQIISA